MMSDLLWDCNQHGQIRNVQGKVKTEKCKTKPSEIKQLFSLTSSCVMALWQIKTSPYTEIPVKIARIKQMRSSEVVSACRILQWSTRNGRYNLLVCVNHLGCSSKLPYAVFRKERKEENSISEQILKYFLICHGMEINCCKKKHSDFNCFFTIKIFKVAFCN